MSGETHDTSPDNHPLLPIAAAQRLRLLYHDPSPTATERTADTVVGVMRGPSIPLRCIEATLAAWNGSSFSQKCALMTGLPPHFVNSRLLAKLRSKPIVDGAYSKKLIASVASMQRSGIEGIRQEFRAREVLHSSRRQTPKAKWNSESGLKA